MGQEEKAYTTWQEKEHQTTTTKRDGRNSAGRVLAQHARSKKCFNPGLVKTGGGVQARNPSTGEVEAGGKTEVKVHF